MEQVISTIMYNGQFWIILVEKISKTGCISIAKYTFGSEPTFNDIIDFYDNVYPYLNLHHSDYMYRPKKKYSTKELGRMENRSHQIFKESQKIYLEEKKRNKKQRREILEQEKFILKCKKKKQKKRGK
jgi:hypothetical protein